MSSQCQIKAIVLFTIVNTVQSIPISAKVSDSLIADPPPDQGVWCKCGMDILQAVS